MRKLLTNLADAEGLTITGIVETRNGICLQLDADLCVVLEPEAAVDGDLYLGIPERILDINDCYSYGVVTEEECNQAINDKETADRDVFDNATYEQFLESKLKYGEVLTASQEHAQDCGACKPWSGYWCAVGAPLRAKEIRDA